MNIKKIILMVLGAVVVFYVGAMFSPFFWQTCISDETIDMGVSDTSWYAVHLTTGEIYYGHIAEVTSDMMKLNDVYYIETMESVDTQVSAGKAFQVESATPKQVYNLVHRGDNGGEVTDHSMYIGRNVISFWEKLTSEAQAVKLIEKANTK
jgi:hypothetical protein